jgi:hypothetical protein
MRSKISGPAEWLAAEPDRHYSTMRRSARSAAVRLPTFTLVALALAAAPPTAVLADGDPASDVLLVQNVFYPYQPKVSPSLERALEGALGSLGRASGVHFKVAIIGTAPELGLVPEYFGHPQAYARFLDREISFNAPQALVTVMPAGYGVMPARYSPAVAHLAVDTHEGSDGLTRSAIDAVVALSRQIGHPVAPPSVRPSASSGSSTPGLVFAAPVALLLLAGLVLATRRRVEKRRSDQGRD